MNNNFIRNKKRNCLNKSVELKTPTSTKIKLLHFNCMRGTNTIIQVVYLKSIEYKRIGRMEKSADYNGKNSFHFL